MPVQFRSTPRIASFVRSRFFSRTDFPRPPWPAPDATVRGLTALAALALAWTTIGPAMAQTPSDDRSNFTQGPAIAQTPPSDRLNFAQAKAPDRQRPMPRPRRGRPPSRGAPTSGISSSRTTRCTTTTIRYISSPTCLTPSTTSMKPGLAASGLPALPCSRIRSDNFLNTSSAGCNGGRSRSTNRST